MTVLEPLKKPAEPLDVIRQWKLDLESLDALDNELDYMVDFRPQIYVPESFGTIPATFAGPLVYAVVNQKGGAGKTTTAVELACAWVAMGYTVRLIDADPQKASVSTSWILPAYGDGPESSRRSLTDVLFSRAPLDDATYYTAFQGLYLVPSGDFLGTVEYDPQAGRDGSLRTALRKSKAPVDITIVDLPPNLGKLSINGLIAAHEVTMPMRVGAMDSDAMTELHGTIRTVQEDENPDLQVRAAVLTGWDQSKFAGRVAARVQRDYPEAVIAPARRSVRIAEAPDHKVPGRIFAPRATTTADYDQLGRILLPVKEAA